MTSQSSFWHYTRILKHFASTRATEVLALQASPILGSVLGGVSLEGWGMTRAGVLLFGSIALTAHIFVFNDWAGYSSDIHDPQRTTRISDRQGISRREVAIVAIALLILASAAFAVIGGLALLVGMAIAALGFLYSSSADFGKNTPIVGSINHLLGGMLHFLLGYTFVHTLDANGLMMSLFFGLVFAGGHLNQEVRDHEGDLLNGIRTTAVVFGRQRTFLASLYTFSAAYALATGLAALYILPRLLVWSPIVWLLHLAWSLRALQRGLGFETARWMQRRYRLLFALLGLAMLVR
jgi:4-hydroxybenzoate polyprenyltransferase